MTERLSRKVLYDLVWSEPMKTLSARFGISDVALKKTCARAEIPAPDRGYWAKKEAGKTTSQVRLPERAPGMAEEVIVAGGVNYWYRDWDKEELLGPLPQPPEFPEPIEAVYERVAKLIGKVVVPRDVREWHPAISRLHKEDERRREKQRTATYPMSWDNPLFDSPFERRRLRILNSLSAATTKMNGRLFISGCEARSVGFTIYQQNVWISLDPPKRTNRHSHTEPWSPRADDATLSLSILQSVNSEAARMTWQDDDAGKLERHVTDIAVQLVLTAEIEHREGAVGQYKWRMERKAQLEEEERKRKLEAERVERERQERLEQARIDRLLRDATSFQQAGEIRKYVEAIRLMQSRNGASSTEDIEQWSRWALAQADRIDPAMDARFLAAMQDKDGIEHKS